MGFEEFFSIPLLELLSLLYVQTSNSWAKRGEQRKGEAWQFFALICQSRENSLDLRKQTARINGFQICPLCLSRPVN